MFVRNPGSSFTMQLVAALSFNQLFSWQDVIYTKGRFMRIRCHFHSFIHCLSSTRRHCNIQYISLLALFCYLPYKQYWDAAKHMKTSIKNFSFFFFHFLVMIFPWQKWYQYSSHFPPFSSFIVNIIKLTDYITSTTSGLFFSYV